MSTTTSFTNDARASGGGSLLVLTVMLALLPIVSVQGPAHATLLDGFNVLFIALYWCRILVRREAVRFPMIVPMWLIVLGSCLGMYSALEPLRSGLFLAKEIYLYLWFVTAVHFLGEHCSATRVVMIWVAIATTLGCLMAVDASTGVFGGVLGGQVRGAGTFENPNMCGNYLVMSMFLAWSAASAGRRGYYLAMPVLVMAVLATASNGALVSLIFGAMVTLGIGAGRRSLERAGGAGLVAMAVIVAVIGIGHDRIVRSSLDLMSRGRAFVGGAALRGAAERYPLWLDAADSLERVPTGVGPGNFNRQGGRISGDAHGAHNEYLGMLVERGALGLAGWVAVLLSGAGALRRLRMATAAGSGELSVDPLCGALAAVALHAMTMELFHFRHLWMFLAVIYAAVGQVEPVLLHPIRAIQARRAIAEGA